MLGQASALGDFFDLPQREGEKIRHGRLTFSPEAFSTRLTAIQRRHNIELSSRAEPEPQEPLQKEFLI